MKPLSSKNLLCLFFGLVFSFALFAQNDTLKAEQLYKDAKELYYDGEYKKSLKLFQKSLKIREAIYGQNHKEIWKVYFRMGKVNRRLRTHQAALADLNKGLAIAIKTEGKNSVDIADFYREMGYVYSQMYQPEKANDFFQKSLKIYKEKYSSESSDVGNIYMSIGNSHIKMGAYTDADDSYRMAHEIFKKSSKPTDKDFYRIYNNHGILFRKTGDYERAMDYAKKALEIKLLHYPPDHESVAKYHSNIGLIHKDKEEYEVALSYFIKTADVYEKALGKKHAKTAGAYGQQADMHAELGRYKKALKIYKKSVAVKEKALRPGHPYLLAGYFNIGMTYEDMKDYDKALEYYHLVLDRFNNNLYTPVQRVAETQERIAKVYFAKGEVDKALLSIRSGLMRLAKNFQCAENDWYSNPKLGGIQSELELLDLLQTKSELLDGRFRKMKLQKDLEEALNTSFVAIELIEKMRRSYQTESARAFLNSDTAPIFEQAVRQAFDLYELTKDSDYLFKAFKVSEKSKASILWQNINAQYALESSKVSEALTDSLHAIFDQISGLEFDLENATDENESTLLQNEILDLKLAYENRIRQLEKENPDYYHLKYAPATVDANEVIAHLPDEGSAVLDYFYDEKDLYIFLCTKEGLTGLRTEMSFDLEKKISEFRKSEISDLLINEKESERYMANLNQLHQLLIAPVSELIKSTPDLIIIPHGVLQLLSFDLLAPPQPENDFRKLNYLLRNHNTQYTWSAALWINSEKATLASSGSYLGFAPKFEIEKSKPLFASSTDQWRNDLVPLTHSASEVTAGQTFYDGKVFTDESASKRLFLTAAPKSRILHLATHALADNRFPSRSGLFFSKEENQNTSEYGFLSLAEIYKLRLQSDLAVMSACNTGYGQLVKGEGVMSLGRAFLHAGCKSIVMSLWLANDEATSIIMKLFYKHTSDGKPKDEALRLAKLDYLKEADALTAHPFFWANLITVGDMRPLEQKTSDYYWWGMVAFGMALLFSGYRKWST